jgi:hypothetical protein
MVEPPILSVFQDRPPLVPDGACWMKSGGLSEMQETVSQNGGFWRMFVTIPPLTRMGINFQPNCLQVDTVDSSLAHYKEGHVAENDVSFGTG